MLQMCCACVGVSAFGNVGRFRCCGLKCSYFNDFRCVFDESAMILSHMSSQSVLKSHDVHAAGSSV